MVESDGSNRGAPCSACGYRNRPGSHTCNLCGAYLYDHVPAPADPRSGTGPVPPSARAPAPAPPPAAPAAPPARKNGAAIALGGGDLYGTGPKASAAPGPVEEHASAPAIPAPPPAPPVRRVPVSISLDGDAGRPPEAAPAEPAPPAPPPLRAEAAPAPAAPAPPVRKPAAPLALDGGALYAKPSKASAAALPLEDAEDEGAAPLAAAAARAPAHALLSATDHPPAAPRAPSRPARDPAPEDAEGLISDLFEEKLRRERATRRAWKAAAIAFGAAVLLGLPGSLAPLSLLLNGTGAVCYAFPVGYLAARRRIGVLGGGVLGALAGALYAVPLALLLALFLPGTGAASWAAQVLQGALSGLASGAWAGRRARR